MGANASECLSCFHAVNPLASWPRPAVPEKKSNEIDLNSVKIEEKAEMSQVSIQCAILSACETEFLLLYSKPLSEDCAEALNKSGYHVYSSDSPSGFLIKAKFHSKFPPDLLANFLKSSENRAKWDKTTSSSSSLEITPEIYLTYTKFHKVIGVSQRDMVIISKHTALNDDILIVSTSYDHENYPLQLGTTRIKIALAGYYLKKTKSGCEVFTLTQADFGGIVPHKVMKSIVSLSIPKFHNDLQAALEKNSNLDSNKSIL